MTVNLTDPIFHDEEIARQHMEAIRWPNGPFCPHCGVVDGITLLNGQSHRAGLRQCNACRGQFTVRTARSWSAAIPAGQVAAWLHLMAASKKGIWHISFTGCLG